MHTALLWGLFWPVSKAEIKYSCSLSKQSVNRALPNQIGDIMSSLGLKFVLYDMVHLADLAFCVDCRGQCKPEGYDFPINSWLTMSDLYKFSILGV